MALWRLLANLPRVRAAAAALVLVSLRWPAGKEPSRCMYQGCSEMGRGDAA